MKGKEKKILRWYFGGNVEYVPFEKEVNKCFFYLSIMVCKIKKSIYTVISHLLLI